MTKMPKCKTFISNMVGTSPRDRFVATFLQRANKKQEKTNQIWLFISSENLNRKVDNTFNFSQVITCYCENIIDWLLIGKILQRTSLTMDIYIIIDLFGTLRPR